MKFVRVKAPAKINLTLEIIGKRDDGFHELQSIMHAVNLFDTLDFAVSNGQGINISLSGNSTEIPYNDSNLVYKTAFKYFQKAQIENVSLSCNIDKKIPVSAGLAGGSTDAAAAVYALNKLFDEKLSPEKIDELLAECGSDTNFCFYGGCALCEGRGEKITTLPALNIPVAIIKPSKVGVSAKEAYLAYASQKIKPAPGNTQALKNLILDGSFDKNLVVNHLEQPVLNLYPELKAFKTPGTFMSGSGSAFFTFDEDELSKFLKFDCKIFGGLSLFSKGVFEC